MSLVHTHNEWDPLEEVVVGTAAGARVPCPDPGLFALEYSVYGSPERIPSGPLPPEVVERTEEELHGLCEALAGLGVRVRRPCPRDLAARVSTPDWSSDAFYDYCPRDSLLAVGDMVIETPMVLRARFLEQFAYRDLLLEYFESGARWISAPKPRLPDETYDPEAPEGFRLRNLEPCFDAANVLRLGTDLLYLVSDSGNELGWRWLQSTLGDAYTVHPCRGIYARTHVDSTIVPLRPGLVLLNPARVDEDRIPAPIRGWDRIWCPELAEIGYLGEHPYSSSWIGMNVLMVNPRLAVVDRRQRRLIEALEGHRIDVLPMQLTHARTLGGAFHCVTLDVRRSGRLETYR
jgi:scyllo-inosamine-4-phosphate amidinotransferase 1